jgi:hypothetical protein
MAPSLDKDLETLAHRHQKSPHCYSIWVLPWSRWKYLTPGLTKSNNPEPIFPSHKDGPCAVFNEQWECVFQKQSNVFFQAWNTLCLALSRPWPQKQHQWILLQRNDWNRDLRRGWTIRISSKFTKSKIYSDIFISYRIQQSGYEYDSLQILYGPFKVNTIWIWIWYRIFVFISYFGQH